MAENSGSGLSDRLETDFTNVRSALRYLENRSLAKGITDTALDSLLRIEATLLMDEKALQNYVTGAEYHMMQAKEAISKGDVAMAALHAGLAKSLLAMETGYRTRVPEPNGVEGD